MITCPNCGELTKSNISIYNENLRKQKFSLTPILPICKHCNEEVKISDKCQGGNVIVLNGTCGSGKSTIAEILAEKGFLAIDGDCAIQVIRHKKNSKKWDFNELAEEISKELDILSLIGNNFVISSVITPNDIDKYKEMFEKRNLKYTFFLLKPQYQTSMERCNSRTCHTSITPEQWIKYFYDLLKFDDSVIVVDNTNMTAFETAVYILEVAFR